VNVDFLLLALSPDFSEEGSVRRQREMRIINFLQDFLQKLEDRGNTVLSTFFYNPCPSLLP